MTERINHAGKARVLLGSLGPEEMGTIAGVGEWLAWAQVHALLALVEQQRTANLIAYWQLHTPQVPSQPRHVEVSLIDIDGDSSIDDLVRERLGL